MMKEKSLFSYWKSCFSPNWNNFEGRARRKEYWAFVLFQILIPFLFTVIFSLCFYELYQGIVRLFWVIYGVLTIIPALSVTVRRLHDTNRSGAWYFILFLPVIGVLALLMFACEDGEPRANQYGADPKGRED